MEKHASETAGRYAHESPLIEQGSVLLDASPLWKWRERHPEQKFFFKSAMLIVECEASTFTMGLILNRPSELTIDGWHLHYGGGVGEGGLFHNAADDRVHPEERRIFCLHVLEDAVAEQLSFPVRRGIWYTTLDGARLLVERGVACKDDFWAFVGYVGWGPEQLDSEVSDGSWTIASVGATLLHEHLCEQRALVTECDEASAADPLGRPALCDGTDMWEALMTRIGHADEIDWTRTAADDRALAEWVRRRLRRPVAAED